MSAICNRCGQTAPNCTCRHPNPPSTRFDDYADATEIGTAILAIGLLTLAFIGLLVALGADASGVIIGLTLWATTTTAVINHHHETHATATITPERDEVDQ